LARTRSMGQSAIKMSPKGCADPGYGVSGGNP
jgi:hypothetical protein